MIQAVGGVAATAMLVTGCSGEPSDEGATQPPVTPETSAPASGTPEESPSAIEETFADVEDPATVRIPTGKVPGLDAVKAWEGARVDATTTPIGAELFLGPGRSAVVLLKSYDGLSARGSGEAELRYWRKRNLFTEGPVEVMDPVVVDGQQLQHARGSSSLSLVDWFVHAVEGLTVEVLFLLPLDFSETEREEYIAQVMATVELE